MPVLLLVAAAWRLFRTHRITDGPAVRPAAHGPLSDRLPSSSDWKAADASGEPPLARPVRTMSVVTVQLGQCGNQVGQELFGIICGEAQEGQRKTYSATSCERFFHRTPRGGKMLVLGSIYLDGNKPGISWAESHHFYLSKSTNTTL